MKVYERIKALRKERGLTAEQVAEAIGVSRATIYRYETKDIENMPITVLEPLSKILHCSPGYLMGWEENTNTYREDFKLSDLEKEIVRKFRTLNNGERAMFLRTIGIEEEKGSATKMA